MDEKTKADERREQRDAKVLQLYRAGRSIHDVAKRVCIDWRTVLRIIEQRFRGKRCPHCRRSLEQRCPECGAKVSEWPENSDVCLGCKAKGK